MAEVNFGGHMLVQKMSKATSAKWEWRNLEKSE